jgi:hypothetical protein
MVKETEIPQWQTQLLDQRLKAIEEHPELVRPISELLVVLNNDQD